MTKYQAIKSAEDVDKVICATFAVTQYGWVLESYISDTQYGIFFEANIKTLKKLGSKGMAISMLDVLFTSYSRMRSFKKNLKELIIVCKIKNDIHFIRTKVEFLFFPSIKKREDITADILNSWIKQSYYKLFSAKKFNFREEIGKYEF